MRRLTAWTFTGSDTARHAEAELAGLSARGRVTLDDGAHLWWPSRRRSPNLRGIENVPLAAAVGTGFWGLLFGALFIVPALNALTCSDTEAFDELLSGVGISSDFLHQLRAAVAPSTSSLIILAESPTIDCLDASYAHWQPQQADAALPDKHHQALRAVFTS